MKKYLELFSLNSKTAFVTGGAGLIGREIVWALATAGARVIILDLEESKGKKLAQQINRAGYNAVFHYFDATQLEKINDELPLLIKKYRAIDVWVNNAYPRTADWGKKIEDLKLESWRKNVDMQLNSYAWLSRQVALQMKKRQIKGSIINIGSIYGVVGCDFSVYDKTNMTCPMAYAAIKGGIINLTRYLASYFGPAGIRINTVCPGGVFNGQSSQFVHNYEKKVPLRRMAKPEDVAACVLFLSSRAAEYITGATQMVDGGWTAI